MRNTFRILAITTLSLTLALPITSYAQWCQNENGWWYSYTDGSYPVNTWKEIDGKYYYFDGNGYMLSNTITPDGYTVGSDGAWIETIVNEPVNNNTNANEGLTPEQIAADEEFDRLLEEASKNGGSTDIVINPGEAGYDNTGHINIGG